MMNKVFSTALMVVLTCTVYTLSVAAAPTPISTFPFNEDFEAGTFPAEIEALSGAQADVFTTVNAANNSSYGVMLEGGSSSWGATPATVAEAYAYTDHVSSLNMEIIPDGDQRVREKLYSLAFLGLERGYRFQPPVISHHHLADTDDRAHSYNPGKYRG